MSGVFILWLVGVCVIQPITKRILKYQTKREPDDEKGYLLLLTEKNTH